MRDDDLFDWDEANEGHIARHNVTREEVQQVFANDHLDTGSQNIDGEERFRTVGHTNRGRWLLVVTTDRGGKTRVITAYDADRYDIELYLKSRGPV